MNVNRRQFIQLAAALPIVGAERPMAVVAKPDASHIDLAPFLIRVGDFGCGWSLCPFVMFPVLGDASKCEVLWLQKSATPGGESWWECVIHDPDQTLERYMNLWVFERPVYIGGERHSFRMASVTRHPKGVIASTPTDDGECIWTSVPRDIL